MRSLAPFLISLVLAGVALAGDEDGRTEINAGDPRPAPQAASRTQQESTATSADSPAPAARPAAPPQPPAQPEVGFWVRLTYNPASEEQMWEDLAAAGATDLFVETFYHGLVIYAGSQITDQRPELAGRDPLAEAIAEGQERGIRVHAWMHCLRWGADYARYPTVPRSPLAERGEAWRCLDYQASPHAEVLVSAAYPEVRSIVRDLCLEVVRTHPGLAGINLDYIRWPEGGEYWFDQRNVQSFIDAGGADPSRDQEARSSAEFRQHSADQVTQLVQDIWSAVHGAHPDLFVSAAFFPGIDENDAWFKAQDWRRWIERGYLNLATPMCYAYDPAGILREVQTVVSAAQPFGVPVWAGLAVHQGTPHPTGVEQLEVVRQRGLAGVVFFSHGWVAERREEFGEIGSWFAGNGL